MFRLDGGPVLNDAEPNAFSLAVIGRVDKVDGAGRLFALSEFRDTRHGDIFRLMFAFASRRRLPRIRRLALFGTLK